MKFRDTKGTL